MTNIILSGANGKMGAAISKIVSSNDAVNIICGIDAMNQESVFGYPVFKSAADIPQDIKGDVIIDFSHPSCLEGLLNYAISNHIPSVICTTGFDDNHKQMLSDASTKIPVFFSANMSIGIALIKDLATQAAKFLKYDFDIEIVEKHHNLKLDAPSGTALALADAIKDAREDDVEYVYDRHAVRKKRSVNEIGIHAVRGGTIVGVHSVIFAGCDEVIEISHQATSKEVFAQGAVRASVFVSKQKNPRFYDMTDLISDMK